MDNVAAHKVAGVEDSIRATGACLLYLPSYSPDLSPIEQVFAKLKALLRGAATCIKEAFWTMIGQLLDASNPPSAETASPTQAASSRRTEMVKIRARALI